jgi:hypothetical protein
LAPLLALVCASGVKAQACEGGLYLNPQIIKGESSAQSQGSVRDLIDFIRPSGLSISPVLNIKDVQEVVAAVKRPNPPCWVYGNPVTGLISGYRPVAVNTEPIQASVLVLADISPSKDGKPVELKSLPAPEQAAVLAKLKTAPCFGIKSGVTTELVKAEQLCGEVMEVVPQKGLGQSYLPSKAALMWQADKWVGIVTRLSSARAATMQNLFGADERVHYAQLLIVPTSQASWGYGLYAHPAVSADLVKKVTAQFVSLKNPPPSLVLALDLGAQFEFAAPSDESTRAMTKAMAIAAQPGGNSKSALR